MIHQHHFQGHLPGQRIWKTSVAVTLCLLFYMLRGRQGESMPAEAAITAIICMQPDLHDTTKSGFSRLAGTLIGAVWGFLFLLLMALFPALGKNRFLLYPLIGAGTLITLHSAVLIRRPDASGLAAIVFVCVVIAYPDIENPLDQAFHRILDVMLGAGIAALVNAVRLPRVKMRNKVFFIPMDQLAENHLTHLSPPVLFQLQRLQQEGARICLMSEHAPAFQTTQLGSVKFNAPMIVMDGAVIYNPNENSYVAVTNLNPASCRWLIKRLEDQSYFVYTVHRDRNCIHHHGQLTEPEKKAYGYLKRSPYRYYLDDDRFSVSDVVYVKMITSREHADQLLRDLEPVLQKMKLRAVIRPQPGLEEGCSLYFYALHADMDHARAHLMQLLRQERPDLESRVMDGQSGSNPLRLLHRVTGEFEPLLLPGWLKARRRRMVRRARAGRGSGRKQTSAMTGPSAGKLAETDHHDGDC